MIYLANLEGFPWRRRLRRALGFLWLLCGRLTGAGVLVCLVPLAAGRKRLRRARDMLSNGKLAVQCCIIGEFEISLTRIQMGDIKITGWK